MSYIIYTMISMMGAIASTSLKKYVNLIATTAIPMISMDLSLLVASSKTWSSMDVISAPVNNSSKTSTIVTMLTN